MFYFSVLLCQCVKTARSPAKLGTFGKIYLDDFAAFHLDSLNGKLNGSMEENMPGSKWTQHEESSPQRLKRCLARNLHIFAPMGRHVGQ